MSYVTGSYDSCATVAVVAGYGISSFVVLQNSQQIAPPQGGSLLVNQPTVLKFTGKVASGRVPNFVWNVPNVAPTYPRPKPRTTRSRGAASSSRRMGCCTSMDRMGRCTWSNPTPPHSSR